MPRFMTESFLRESSHKILSNNLCQLMGSSILSNSTKIVVYIYKST